MHAATPTQQYLKKTCSASAALDHVREGDMIIVPTGVGEPPTLLTALSNERQRFHDVKVARELKFSHDGREVEVTFHVIEGVQYRLADAPKVVGVKSLPAEALEAMDRVKPGDTYKQADIDGRIRGRGRLCLFRGLHRRWATSLEGQWVSFALRPLSGKG